MTFRDSLVAGLVRLFGPPRLALAVAAWLLLVLGWGAFARTRLPIEHRTRWDAGLEERAPLYARFDSGWYLSIIERGYEPPPIPGKVSNHPFFPLYPFTARILHVALGLDGFLAGLAVSYLCLFLAIPLFYREGVRRLGEADGRAAVLFLLLFPTAFFLASVYAESMFLLLALLAFRDARSGPAWRAVLWGVLLGLTRASAVAAAPALFLAALEGSPAKAPGAAQMWRPRLWRALAIGAVPVVAVLAWIYGIGLLHGEPGLYFRSMGGWKRASSSIEGVVAWFQSMRVRVADSDWKEDPTLALDYGVAILVACVAAWQLWRRRWSDGAWTAAAMGLPMTTGLSGGMPRFLMVVYPVYYALAEGSRGRPIGRGVWWAVSGLLLLAAAARFVNWHWVA